MLVKLHPKAYVSSLADLGPQFFRDKGLKGLIFDLDNTITPWRSNSLDPRVTVLLTRLKESGLKICIVSNALTDRVERLLKPLGIPGIARAAKPRRKAFKQALQILGTQTKETAMIGDQIFTDILGGNRLGLYTILVVPMSKREFVGTKVVRLLEGRLIKRMIKKGVVKAPRRKKNF